MKETYQRNSYQTLVKQIPAREVILLGQNSN